jgi:hypothetical protein
MAAHQIDSIDQFDPKNKKIAALLLRLFEEDKIEDAFYDALIRLMKSFTDDYATWTVNFLDIWKGVKHDVPGGMDGENSQIREYIRQNFIRILQKKYSNGICKLNALAPYGYSFSVDRVEQMDPESYTDYIGWVKMGCDWSTDHDITIFCPESANRDGSVAPLFSSEMRRLRSELRDIGYDMTREIDLNQVIVVDRQIVASTKGGKETANIILATHDRHLQQMSATGEIPLILEICPLDPIDLTAEDFEAKVRSFAKYCWDYLKYLVPKATYQRMRDTRIEVYGMGMRAVMTELGRILDLIITDPKEAEAAHLDTVHWRSAFKSLTMKAVQIIVYHHEDTMSYTKAEIAEDSRKIAAYYEGVDEDTLYVGCLYNLTRGARGSFVPGLFDHLVRSYLQIVEEILDDASIRTSFTLESEYLLDLHVQDNRYPGDLSRDMIRRFLQSPKDASPEFEELWAALMQEKTIDSVNLVFVQDLKKSTKALLEIQHLVPAETAAAIGNQFVMIGQRTDEWKELLSNFYACGNNGAEIGDSFQAKFNLIRGSILEEWCSMFCPVFHLQDELEDAIAKNQKIRSDLMKGVTRVIPLDTGLLVEQIGLEGCSGAAPDLLLLCLRESGGEIATPLLIPVEMKGLKVGDSAKLPKENGDYRRGLSLARRQIGSVKQILQTGFIIEFGLVVLTWIYDEQLGMEVYTVPF